MDYVVMGTTGHIDHGKTSLVKALSGTDTDRLKEERERGITIDLGFAYMTLPSGIILSIIDVPGHEKFVRNMVAGAAGIDMVVLVIAADDGVMPQTREHLDICSLLGIQRGLVAVTKADTVDEEWLKETVSEIREFLRGTFLEGSPIIPVSSLSGEGVKELVADIDTVARSITQRKRGEVLRLPVDRSFTIKGFGTVVTGTLVSGTVTVGEEVEIIPVGTKSRVRGIQIHGTQVNDGFAGSRVALNLQGVERESIRRGDTVTNPGKLTGTRSLEAIVSLLSSAPRPLKEGAGLMLHIYSASALASISLLNSKEIRPGESTYARIRIKEPMTVLHGDRFVLRSSDSGTIGGGIVLDVDPPKRGRQRAVEDLGILSSGDAKGKVLLYIKREGLEGITVDQLSIKANTPHKVIETAISFLISSKKVVKIGDVLVSAEAMGLLKKSALEILASFHKKEPMKAGMSVEELRTRIKVSQRIMERGIEGVVRDELVISERDMLRLASHMASGGETKDRIEKIYAQAGLTPPTMSELLEALKIKEKEAMDLLMLLSKENRVVKVKDLFFSKESIDSLIAKVKELYAKKSEMTPLDFKEITGLSRKFAIPLLEYLDLQKVTIRVGDVRKLRRG